MRVLLLRPFYNIQTNFLYFFAHDSRLLSNSLYLLLFFKNSIYLYYLEICSVARFLIFDSSKSAPRQMLIVGEGMVCSDLIKKQKLVNSRFRSEYSYRISSYSCRGNYSFLGAWVRQLFKGGNYSKEETIGFFLFCQ